MSGTQRSTLCISVGCNVNGRPTHVGARVKAELGEAIYHATHCDHDDGGPVRYSCGAVTGTWEGVPETTILWVGTVPSSAVPQLRRNLSYLAESLGQEAIGFVCQPDTETLIYPPTDQPERRWPSR